MFNKIKNKIILASFIIPAYAADITLSSTDTNLTKVQKFTIDGFVSTAVSLIIIVASLAFVFMLILGGFSWVTSGGDEKKVAAARSKVTSALIGLVIVFAAWAILALINALFGVDILGSLTLPKFYQ